MSYQLFAFLTATLLASWCSGKTTTVSPSDSYAPFQSAVAGDTILMSPGTYSFRVLLTATGTPTAPITITALDPTNPPVVDAAGSLVENLPGSSTTGDRGRGLWQIVGGAYYNISHVKFQNARTSSQNSAGIRFYNSVGIIMRYCKFFYNDNGITGGNMQSQALVEYCEFGFNGNTAASSPTHNVYIYGGDFTLRYSYLHDPTQAQNFHLRCAKCLVEYNYVINAASYAGDLMTSGDGDVVQTMTLRGNVIVQGSTAQNHGQHLAVFNDAGTANWTPTLIAEYNTLVITDTRTNILHLANTAADGNYTLIMNNNILTGIAYLADVPASATISGSNNFNIAGFSNGVLANTFTASAAPVSSTYVPTGAPLLNNAAPSLARSGVPPFQFSYVDMFTGVAATGCCSQAARVDGGATIGAIGYGTAAPPTSSPIHTATPTTVFTSPAPPPATSTSPAPTAAPILIAVLRIPGDGFAEIILSSNATIVALLYIAVRSDLAGRLNISVAAILLNSVSVGSLVANFTVTDAADTTATAVESTLSSTPSTSWLSNTQQVYSQYSAAGQAGAVLDATNATVVVLSAPASPTSSGCQRDCNSVPIAVAVAVVFIAAVVGMIATRAYKQRSKRPVPSSAPPLTPSCEDATNKAPGEGDDLEMHAVGMESGIDSVLLFKEPTKGGNSVRHQSFFAKLSGTQSV